MRPIVMVVDPDARFAAELVAILTASYGVVVESGSKGALQRLNEGKQSGIDAVVACAELAPYLTDSPAEEGIFLIELLAKSRGLPVVVFLNRPDARLRDACSAAGAESVRAKRDLSSVWLEEALGLQKESNDSE